MGPWIEDVELGLRGKLRFPTPNGTYGSSINGDGTYTFATGGPNTSKAWWSLDWSINSNLDGSGTSNLNQYLYKLGVDSDASQGTNFTVTDPINVATWLDNSFGNNSTAQSAGIEATNATDYANLISTSNLAQNSWQAGWIVQNLNSSVNGTYDIYLEAWDSTGSTLLARTDIQIIAGTGGAPVPEPTTMLLFGAGIAGLAAVGRKKRS